MSINELKANNAEVLKESFSKTEMAKMLSELIEKETGFDAAQQIVYDNQTISKLVVSNINQQIERIVNGEPFQYVLGYTWFYDLKIKVNQNVLIPRPETEELVHWIVSNQSEETEAEILDIGTGSGCIALALKSVLKNAYLTAVDISSKALEVAIENGSFNNLQVHFEAFDVLSYLPNTQSALYDIIVSNPPYIPSDEKYEMANHVVKYEPSIALFTPKENALIFYEAILIFSRQYLKNNGQLYFEMHENKAAAVYDLMAKYGFTDIILKKDAQGKNRMIKGNWIA